MKDEKVAAEQAEKQRVITLASTKYSVLDKCTKLIEIDKENDIDELTAVHELEENENSSMEATFESVRSKRCLLGRASSPVDGSSSIVEPVPSDYYINMALTYLYKRASLEIKWFNSHSMVDKHTVEEEGGGDVQNNLQAGGMNIKDLGDLNFNFKVPVIDIYSPLAVSITLHVHRLL